MDIQSISKGNPKGTASKATKSPDEGVDSSRSSEVVALLRRAGPKGVRWGGLWIGRGSGKGEHIEAREIGIRPGELKLQLNLNEDRPKMGKR